MAEEEPKAEIKQAEDLVRVVKNWVFTFGKEYDLSEDKIKDLHEAIDKVAVEIGGVECKPGEEKPEVKSKESDDPKVAQSFEKALSSAIEKKQSELDQQEPIKPESEEMIEDSGYGTCKPGKGKHRSQAEYAEHKEDTRFPDIRSKSSEKTDFGPPLEHGMIGSGVGNSFYAKADSTRFADIHACSAFGAAHQRFAFCQRFLSQGEGRTFCYAAFAIIAFILVDF